MKTFKQLQNELIEADYESAWQKVKRGASELGSGAAEAGKTFISKDLPVLVKKGEEAYDVAKPVMKKVVGAAGKTVEQGGRAVKQWANEDVIDIINFISDESISEDIRHEVLDSVMEDDGWRQTAKDVIRGGLKGLTFGYSPELAAKVKTGFSSGPEYEKELAKQKAEDEEAQKRSPIGYAAGEIGSAFVGPGAVVLGAAKGAKMARGALAGASAARKAKKAEKAAEVVKKAESDLDTIKKAGWAADTDKVKKLEKAKEKATKAADVAKAAKGREELIKGTSVLKPTKAKVGATIAGTGLGAVYTGADSKKSGTTDKAPEITDPGIVPEKPAIPPAGKSQEPPKAPEAPKTPEPIKKAVPSEKMKQKVEQRKTELEQRRKRAEELKTKVKPVVPPVTPSGPGDAARQSDIHKDIADLASQDPDTKAATKALSGIKKTPGSASDSFKKLTDVSKSVQQQSDRTTELMKQASEKLSRMAK